MRNFPISITCIAKLKLKFSSIFAACQLILGALIVNTDLDKLV